MQPMMLPFLRGLALQSYTFDYKKKKKAMSNCAKENKLDQKQPVADNRRIGEV